MEVDMQGDEGEAILEIQVDWGGLEVMRGVVVVVYPVVNGGVETSLLLDLKEEVVVEEVEGEAEAGDGSIWIGIYLLISTC
jgi:hypothetical protein